MRLLLSVLLLLTAAAEAELFYRHSKWFTVGPKPCAAEIVDFDADGIPEIVTANRGPMSEPTNERPANDEVSVLFAKESLDYTEQPRMLAGFAPWCLAVANMDGLKWPDLVVGNFYATRERDLSVFLHLGRREGASGHLFNPHHFQAPAESISYERQRDIDNRPVFTKPGITAVLVGMFNGDEYRDVVATGWSSDVLLVFPGQADPVLGEAYPIPAPGGPRDLRAKDFDGDGALDLAVALYSSSEIGFWKGDGKGQFEEVERIPSRAPLPHQLLIEDMNGDGVSDLVVSHCGPADLISILYGDSEFSFTISQDVPLGEDRARTEHDVRDILVEDFDADGRPDIAAACAASNQVLVLKNKPSDSAQPIRFETERYSFNSPDGSPRALAVGDLNGDDKRDLAVALWEANAVALLLRR